MSPQHCLSFSQQWLFRTSSYNIWFLFLDSYRTPSASECKFSWQSRTPSPKRVPSPFRVNPPTPSANPNSAWLLPRSRQETKVFERFRIVSRVDRWLQVWIGKVCLEMNLRATRWSWWGDVRSCEIHRIRSMNQYRSTIWLSAFAQSVKNVKHTPLRSTALEW